MIDPTDPNDIEKIVDRAVKMQTLLKELRMIVEITSPGSGDLYVKSILVGGIITQNDEDYEKFYNDIANTVATVRKKLKEHAIKMLRDEPQDDPDEDFDPAKLHSNKKSN